MGAAQLKYKRLVLKISGEALGPESPDDGAAPGKTVLGLDLARVGRIAQEAKSVHEAGGEIAIVVGGGNFVRGRSLAGNGLGAVTADTMGMMATVINGLAMRDALENIGVEARLLTAISMPSAAEPYCQPQCVRHLKRGRAVVLAAGVGNPHFTTDSGAALRAREIGAQAVLKGTNVDGVYSDDPKRNPDAVRYRKLTFTQVIERNLGVMDITAVTLCREGGIPIRVFDLGVDGNVLRAACGEDIGTLVEGE